MEDGQNKEFIPIEPGIWKPEKEEDFIEGLLVQKRADVGKNKSKAYYLEKDGKQTMVWGSAILDDRMEFVDVKDYVKIIYKGKKESKAGQQMNVYKVMKALS